MGVSLAGCVVLCFTALLWTGGVATCTDVACMRGAPPFRGGRQLKGANNFFTDVFQSVATVVAAPGPSSKKAGKAVQAVLGAVKDAGQAASESGDHPAAAAAAAVTAAATAVTGVVSAAQAPAPAGTKAVQTILGTVAIPSQITVAALDAADPPQPGDPAPKSATQKASAVFKKFNDALSSNSACAKCRSNCAARGGQPQGPAMCFNPADVVHMCAPEQCQLPASAAANEPSAGAIAAAG